MLDYKYKIRRTRDLYQIMITRWVIYQSCKITVRRGCRRSRIKLEFLRVKEPIYVLKKESFVRRCRSLAFMRKYSFLFSCVPLSRFLWTKNKIFWNIVICFNIGKKKRNLFIATRFLYFFHYHQLSRLINRMKTKLSIQLFISS